MESNNTIADKLFIKNLPANFAEIEPEKCEQIVYDTLCEMGEEKDYLLEQFLIDKHTKSLSMPDSDIRRKLIEEIYTELFDSYFPSPR